MLGTEYSWLISISEPADGIPRVRLASTGLLTIAVGLFCLLCISLRAEPAHRQLLRDAAVAAKAGEIDTVIAKLEAARAMRPEYPRVLNNLARFYLAAGRANDAMAQLRELAAMGLKVDVTHDDAFAALRHRADFPALAQALARNDSALGSESVAVNLPEVTGIIEGFAINPGTPEAYFSDVRNRCIWYGIVGDHATSLKQFSTDTDGLLGVFALKIDGSRHQLWASCSAVPEMRGYGPADRGKAFLAAYALDSHRLLRTYPLPADNREHVLGDLVVAPDGTIFATDSTSPVIWRLAADGSALEKWVESEEFVSLQGIAFDSAARSLYVADYGNGLWRIDLASRAPKLCPAPAQATLFGIDGLYATPGGLVAVQNGINPQRVVRIALDAAGMPAAVRVLSAGNPLANDLALGQVIDDHFEFVGNSGWSLFEDSKIPDASRTVSIFRTALE
jgi:hypothetical protein